MAKLTLEDIVKRDQGYNAMAAAMGNKLGSPKSRPASVSSRATSLGEKASSWLNDAFFGGGPMAYSPARFAETPVDWSPPGLAFGSGQIVGEQAGKGDVGGVGRELAMAIVPGASKAGQAGKKLTDKVMREISTRLPTAVKSTEDPFKDMLLADFESFAKSPIAEHNAKLATDIPGLKVDSTDWRDHANAYMDHATENLNFLFDLPSEPVRDRMGMWYDGANKIATNLGEKYSVPVQSSAGAAAGLSPQKDWFQNASLAERVGDVLHQYDNVPMNMDMINRLPENLRSPKFEDLILSMKDKKLTDIEDPLERALWVRMFDEANFDRSYRSVLPEGDFGNFVTNKDGSEGRVAWGSLPEINKAIGSYESGGDINTISKLMGEKHKVRSFDNNIVEPDSDYGHVTADTHAVAANQMRPLSGNTPEVAQNFGNALDKKFWGADGFKAAKSSSKDGLSGTYALNSEPYRRVGEKRGLKPRKVQSIAWEVGRSVFPDTFKTKGNMKLVDNIWKLAEQGAITADDARRKIVELSGGFKVPEWFNQSPVNTGSGPMTYRGLAPGVKIKGR
jgi:hypothetical protein